MGTWGLSRANRCTFARPSLLLRFTPPEANLPAGVGAGGQTMLGVCGFSPVGLAGALVAPGRQRYGAWVTVTIWGVALP
ncbi:MAG: hypothetical protein PWP23_1322 [Candidatus Sumerlaeota bacterium]|nr:hypothetical protein [Candidatus Sumerlaeota bacterium]